ncbi:PREDICTED: protein scarlet-like, partial [Ceratosolen solmsi marchali]|uniref:Protein scarlet-like n=1 Tax=Ceratosolen solmsi marchali TaxID=326594 RepID=A0AAJ6YSG5_9HYME
MSTQDKKEIKESVSATTRSSTKKKLTSEQLMTAQTQWARITTIRALTDNLNAERATISLPETLAIKDKIDETHNTVITDHKFIVTSWPQSGIAHEYFTKNGVVEEAICHAKATAVIMKLCHELGDTTQPIKTSLKRISNSFSTWSTNSNMDEIPSMEDTMNETHKTFEKWIISRSNEKKCLLLYYKLKWLIHRGFVQVLKNPSMQFLQLLQKLSIGIIAGLCFFGTVNSDQLGIQAVQGVIFILVSENTFFPMYSTLSLIPQELPLFVREYRAGLYSCHIYYMARIISLLPGTTIEPILFTTIIYWISGLLNSFKAFSTTVCIVLLTMNVSTACGFFFSVAFESEPLAMAYLIPFDSLLMITMGAFVKFSSLPIYIDWIKYISWLFHSTEALSIVQWHTVKNITCSSTDVSCITDGQQVLELYGFSIENLNLDILLMIIVYFLFHLLGYILLVKK